MYKIKLTDYVPEPKPAFGDYIVAAHYYAAWKRGAAELHGGFDDLHGYPERTPLAGYYDEGDPFYHDYEIKWALEHGINCFIHCWYRYRDNVGRPVTRASLRCAHALHEGFFSARYEQMMKFAIMFEASPRWGATDAEDMIENLMPFWLENYFLRGNYLTIDNKPVLFTYSWREICHGIGGIETQREVFDRCREICRKHGFDGMLFAAMSCLEYPHEHDELIASGYDFAFSYRTPFDGENHPAEKKLLSAFHDFYENMIALDPNFYIPTASCFGDPEPRTTKHWLDMGYTYDRWGATWYLSPDGYRELLADCRRMSDALPKSNPGRGIIMIDNWNEWDEGHFVAPSHAFGFGYLQAIREELSGCDNLPDYRMPQDIGLSCFNRTWGEPDLEAYCKMAGR